MDIGVWCDVGGADVVELLATTGVGWLGIDAQHGAFDDREVRLAVAATADLVCRVYVRVVANEAWAIGRALDAGAHGVIVPMVSSPDEASAAVAAAKYPPLGRRSWGPTRGGYGRQVPDVQQANESVLCAVMVETRAGLEDVDHIAAVDGIGMIFVGPHDLAIALGTTVDDLLADASPGSALARIVRACERSGIAAGAFAGSDERASRLEALGFTAIVPATASGLLASAARSLGRR